jgi:hypothetical protein
MVLKKIFLSTPEFKPWTIQTTANHYINYAILDPYTIYPYHIPLAQFPILAYFLPVSSDLPPSGAVYLPFLSFFLPPKLVNVL